MTPPTKRVLIVGGGLAGLACAVRLLEAGAQPLIVEASDDVGGRVRTDLVDGSGWMPFADQRASARRFTRRQAAGGRADDRVQLQPNQ